MLRSMMQVYVKGSKEAVALYQKAFNAELVSEHKNEDGSYLHAELNIYGQILALSEVEEAGGPGDTMQFCLHFEESEQDKVEQAYEALKEGAMEISTPLGPCFFSKCMTSLVDKFGVSWCIFA